MDLDHLRRFVEQTRQERVIDLQILSSNYSAAKTGMVTSPRNTLTSPCQTFNPCFWSVEM